MGRPARVHPVVFKKRKKKHELNIEIDSLKVKSRQYVYEWKRGGLSDKHFTKER
jgi:hypothetical protein